jgi:hypothetical protein
MGVWCGGILAGKSTESKIRNSKRRTKKEMISPAINWIAFVVAVAVSNVVGNLT